MTAVKILVSPYARTFSRYLLLSIVNSAVSRFLMMYEFVGVGGEFMDNCIACKCPNVCVMRSVCMSA